MSHFHLSAAARSRISAAVRAADRKARHKPMTAAQKAKLSAEDKARAAARKKAGIHTHLSAATKAKISAEDKAKAKTRALARAAARAKKKHGTSPAGKSALRRSSASTLANSVYPSRYYKGATPKKQGLHVTRQATRSYYVAGRRRRKA